MKYIGIVFVGLLLLGAIAPSIVNAVTIATPKICYSNADRADCVVITPVVRKTFGGGGSGNACYLNAVHLISDKMTPSMCFVNGVNPYLGECISPDSKGSDGKSNILQRQSVRPDLKVCVKKK